MNQQRLDPETAQQLIARAAELQQQHLETIAPDQLEALAAEVGIRPEFVRRALSEAAEVPVVAVQATQPRRRRRQKREIVPLSAAQVRQATLPAALYATYTFFVLLNFNRWNGQGQAEFLFLLVQPLALALYLGWRQPHRRMAALTGAALAILPMSAATLAESGHGIPFGIGFIAALPYAVVAAGACQLKRWWAERREEMAGDEAEA